MKIKNVLLTLIFVFSSNAVFAQTSLMSSGLRRNIATVMFFGVGGAVLGLSTLSFYGKPQEHIENITIGFALGVIGGSIYVVSQSTTESVGLNNPLWQRPQKSPPKLLQWAWNF